MDVRLKFGIPCSQLKGVIEDAEIPCTSEEQAFSLAAGCILAGKEPVVYIQNSGLGRIGDVILSLYHPYKIPLPKLILSVRVHPNHHTFMGNVTYDFLDLFEYDLDFIEIISQKTRT
jgi:phosphonopyruvate decarboxylase